MTKEKKIDISQQELIEEYGMTEENAQKLLLDLPNIVQEFLKEAEARATQQQPQPQPQELPFQMSSSRQLTGNSDKDLEILDEIIFITEQDMEDLKDITDEEIMEALDYLDQIFTPIEELISNLINSRLGETGAGFGGPIIGPALQTTRKLTGKPESLMKLLAKELFKPEEKEEAPVSPNPELSPEEIEEYYRLTGATPISQAQREANIKAREELRKKTRPKRAPAPIRRSFLTRLRAQANAMDEKYANDEMPAFYDIYSYADKIVMSVDLNDFVIEDGVLKTHAVATANMVQKYGDKKVLKDAGELKKACNYARQIPITDDHPADKMVTSQDEIKGFTGQVTYDEEGKNIKCSVEIEDEDLIEKVKKGKTDVSIGFMCDMDNTPGELDGEKYDAIQTNIILNHLAIVDNGRCPGGTCGLGMDHKEKCTKNDCDNCDNCEGKSKIPNIKVKEDKKIEADTMSDDEKDQKTEAERAMSHFNISMEEWEKMTEEEKAAKIAQLPPLGSGGEDKGFEGQYILEDTEGHTHSVALDKEGNGKSSTDGNHFHDIEKNDCQVTAGHKHGIMANASKDDDPENNPEEKPAAADLDVSTHEKMLKEKVDAIKSLSDKLAREAGQMTPSEIQALISDIQTIGWDLRDVTSVIQAKGISVDSALVDEAKELMSLDKKLTADNKTVTDEHTTLVDEIMDHEPPRDRAFYDEKPLDEVKELVLLLDKVAPEGDATSHSNDGQSKSVQDAYKKVVDKRLGK